LSIVLWYKQVADFLINCSLYKLVGKNINGNKNATCVLDAFDAIGSESFATAGEAVLV